MYNLKYFFVLFLFVSCHKVTPVGRALIVQHSTTGDDYDILQNALNYQSTHPGTTIVLTDTQVYHSSHGLLFAHLNGSDYSQVELDIEGPVNARNTPVSTTIKFTNPSDFGLAVQNCKGCTIKNINFIGAYDFPSGLNAQQIDTLFFKEWIEPNGSSKTSPYAGIVIDPFSDSRYYAACSNCKMYPSYINNYVQGMGLGGSTAIDIENCQITNFVTGIMVTPSMQENGELINVVNCRIDNCKVPYAYSQAQSKTNRLIDLMSWGNCHTIVDGCSYGFTRGDGSTSPIVDVMNVAGYNHQLYNISAASFPISWNNVYAETLFKLGYVRNNYAGTNFSNFQIDFQSESNLPSPDFYIGGDYINWTNCMLRLYNGNTYTRLILNANGNVFRGGVINNPPIKTSYNNTTITPYFDRTTMYYTAGYVKNKNYDSLVYLGNGPLVINRSTFSGYFLSNQSSSCKQWDMISCRQDYLDQVGWDGSNVTPVGLVDHISNDTVFVTNTGWGLHTGDHPDLFVDKIKNN